MSKMGISTIRSYKGAQVFERGLDSELIDEYFTGTPSASAAWHFRDRARTLMRHASAFAETTRTGQPGVRRSYNYRSFSESHLFSPEA